MRAAHCLIESGDNMTRNVVNLDALLLRDDLAAPTVAPATYRA